MLEIPSVEAEKTIIPTRQDPIPEADLEAKEEQVATAADSVRVAAGEALEAVAIAAEADSKVAEVHPEAEVLKVAEALRVVAHLVGAVSGVVVRGAEDFEAAVGEVADSGVAAEAAADSEAEVVNKAAACTNRNGITRTYVRLKKIFICLTLRLRIVPRTKSSSIVDRNKLR